MKKCILTLIAASMGMLTAFATWEGNGYYRVQNYKSDRYAYLLDNYADIDYTATKVNMKAIELWTGVEKMESDPATVLFIKQIDSSKNTYDIQAQGTGVYDMVKEYLYLRYKESYDAYLAYGVYSAVTKYLGDPKQYEDEMSYMSDNAKGDYRYWRLLPVENDDDNFFGFKPTVQANGVNYCVSFCGFDYEITNSSMKACYVTQIDAQRGYAIYEEAGAKIGAGMPVFIKCVSAAHTDNKVTVGKHGVAPATGNKLVGVYFNNNGEGTGHVNRVEYDPSTMRVLGTLSDGSLGYVTASNLDFIPRNTSYLPVPAGSKAELKLVTASEYAEIIAGIKPVESVTLSASQLSLTIGESATLTAQVNPSDAEYDKVEWSTSNAAIATVTQEGVVKAVGAGSATITASCEGKSATCAVTVAKKTQQITWNQDLSALAEGDVVQMNASASSGLAVAYEIVSGAECAEINGSKLTAKAAGTCQIKATQAGNEEYDAAEAVTLTATIAPSSKPVESITLSSSQLSLTVGESATLTAQVNPSDAEYDKVEWTTSNAAVVTVTQEGVVKAVGVGSATITASCEGKSATCAVTVTKKSQQITWNQDLSALTEGDVVQLNASASSGLAVAYEIVSGAECAEINGSKLTAKAAGTCQIKATQAGNEEYDAAEAVTLIATIAQYIKPVESITLSATELTIGIGESETLTVQVNPADADYDTIEWTSSNTDVARVTQDGLVEAVGLGVAKITATCEGKTATCAVTVVKKSQQIVWDQDFSQVKAGDVIELTATATSGLDVVYEVTLGAAFAEIEGNVFTAKAVGLCEIQASQPGNDEYAKAQAVKVSVKIWNPAGLDVNTAESLKIDGRRIINPNGVMVEAYTLQGVKAYSGADPAIELPTGIYIIKAAGLAIKAALE